MKRYYTHSTALTSALGLLVLLFQFGCAGPAASKTTKGAATGAIVGGLGGLATGQSGGTTAALAGGGALIGGVVGAIQDGNERKQQETMAQQRAYSAAVARQKQQVAKAKAVLQEELEVAEGFRITENEINEMTDRAETAEGRLKALQAKKQAAIDRKKLLDEMEEREKEALAEIERLERELAELEGNAPETVSTTPSSKSTSSSL